MAAATDLPAGPPARAPSAGSGRERLAYVPALDGLRAVAVVGVMLFHGGVSWVPGGYLGVDVFFVLSGFLITTLLLRERVATGRIDLRAFWLRRLRRLLPALLVLLAAVGVATPFFVDGPFRASVRDDGLAALAYVANWRFVLTEQSYFAGLPSPLRHLWSLAVEEQWYVAFPVVAALALGGRGTARRANAFLAGLLVATAASVAWMAHLAAGGGDPSRAYYGTDSRAHSLLAGAVLAVVAARWPLRRFRRTLGVAGLAGAAGVVAAYGLVSEADAWMYRGGYLALAVATAGVVAAIALPARPLPLARVLGARPLVAVGRVSYGLYLWHWPVNVFLTPARVGLDGPGLLAVRTAVAVAGTLASYHLVELPVRRGGLDGLRLRFPGPVRSRPATTAGCVALVAWLLVAGSLGGNRAGPTSGGIPAALAGRPIGVPEDEVPEAPVVTVPVAIREAMAASGLPPVPDDRPVEVMLVGDSVAQTLGYGAPTEAPPSIRVVNRGLLGCGIVEGFARPGGQLDRSAQRCGDWIGFWQVGAQRDPPDVVVLQFGAWEVYDYKIGPRLVPSASEEMRLAMRAGLDKGIAALLAVKPDVRFLFVGVACMREENPKLGGAESERNDIAKVRWVNQVFEEYSDELGPRSAYVDLGELLCPGGEFREAIDGQVIRPDGSHFKPEHSRPVWAWLAERITAFARTPVPAAEGAAPAAPGHPGGAPRSDGGAVS